MSTTSPRDLIQVPLDGSELAERALTVAAALARRRGSALRLVHVHLPVAADPIHVEGLPVIDEHLRSLRRNHEQAYLERTRDGLAAGVSTSVALLDGPPAPALADDARAQGAALIVMTTHGRSGIERALLGSVADELLRISPVPLLLVRDRRGGESRHFRRIVVPLDRSPLSERIVEHALNLAHCDPRAELFLIDVVPPQPRDKRAATAAPTGGNRANHEERAHRYLDGVARKLTARGARVQTRVLVSADIVSAILNFARIEGADVVALASHGRSGLKRLALGSVADTVVRAATTSVLVLGPRASGLERTGPTVRVMRRAVVTPTLATHSRASR